MCCWLVKASVYSNKTLQLDQNLPPIYICGRHTGVAGRRGEKFRVTDLTKWDFPFITVYKGPVRVKFWEATWPWNINSDSDKWDKDWQDCALKNWKKPSVLNLWNVRGAQHRISMKKLRFSSYQEQKLSIRDHQALQEDGFRLLKLRQRWRHYSEICCIALCVCKLRWDFGFFNRFQSF